MKSKTVFSSSSFFFETVSILASKAKLWQTNGWFIRFIFVLSKFFVRLRLRLPQKRHLAIATTVWRLTFSWKSDALVSYVCVVGSVFGKTNRFPFFLFLFQLHLGNRSGVIICNQWFTSYLIEFTFRLMCISNRTWAMNLESIDEKVKRYTHATIN